MDFIKSTLGWIPAIMLLGASAPGIWLLVQFQEAGLPLEPWGYLGAFVVQLISSASLFIPTPAPAYIMAMGILLNPILLGIAGGLGAAIGELSGYYLGTKGRRVIAANRLHRRFHTMVGQRSGLAILVFGILPLPCDFIGLWAGTIKYPIWRFLVLLAPGKVFKITYTALAASYGFHLFGDFGF